MFPPALTRVAAWTPAALLTVGVALVVGGIEFAPGDSDRLLAVFPPWWPSDRALAAASAVAAVTGAGPLGFTVAVASRRPDLARALRLQGALWVIDGRAFPACIAPQRTSA